MLGERTDRGVGALCVFGVCSLAFGGGCGSEQRPSAGEGHGCEADFERVAEEEGDDGECEQLWDVNVSFDEGCDDEEPCEATAEDDEVAEQHGDDCGAKFAIPAACCEGADDDADEGKCVEVASGGADDDGEGGDAAGTPGVASECEDGQPCESCAEVGEDGGGAEAGAEQGGDQEDAEGLEGDRYWGGGEWEADVPADGEECDACDQECGIAPARVGEDAGAREEVVSKGVLV